MILWAIEVEQDLPCLSHKLPQPLVHGEYIYTIIEKLDGAYIKAFRLSDGKEMLSYHIPSENKCLPFQNFSIINNTLYYTDRDYVVHAFSLK